MTRTLLALVMLSGCTDALTPQLRDPDVGYDTSRYPLDDVLRFGHGQMVGTHNSYHLLPDPVLHPAHDYSQPTLTDQLELYGVRQFELDIYWREGVGLEVFHLPLIDEVSSCERLTDCLSELRAWSDSHPDHYPLVVWIEPKDDSAGFLSEELTDITAHWADFEEDLRTAIPADQRITPARVRGDYATLREAILTDGWPTLRETRGKILIALLESGDRAQSYFDHTESPVAFRKSGSPEDPDAAVFKDANHDEAPDLAAMGFVLTTNTDTAETPIEERQDRREAAMAAGFHNLATDWPAGDGDADPGPELPGGGPVRCHPITAPADCTAALLEDLE